MDGLIIGVVLVITLFMAFLIEKKPWGWKGYEIIATWRERGLQGISAFWAWITDFKKIYIFVAVIIGFALLILFIGLYSQLFSILFNPNETKEFDSKFALAFLGTITGGVALFTGFIAILRTETAEQGLITDRINKATEGLGKNDENGAVIAVRLSALLALERVAQDSIRDHISVMKILCAYICTNSKLDNSIDLTKPLRADIGVAVTIIAGRDKRSDGKKRIQIEKNQEYHIDLRHCNLRGVDLFRANLTNAWLGSVNLGGAGIIGADLSGALLIDTNLSGATLANTDLKGTTTRISFAYTGDFSECKNLTQEQVNQMFLGQAVKLPKDLEHPQKNSKYDKPYNTPEDFMEAREEWIKETPLT